MPSVLGCMLLTEVGSIVYRVKFIGSMLQSTECVNVRCAECNKKHGAVCKVCHGGDVTSVLGYMMWCAKYICHVYWLADCIGLHVAVCCV